MTEPLARPRHAALEMSPDEFRAAGYQLVDRLADFLGSMPRGKVTTGEEPDEIRNVLGAALSLPEGGAAPNELLQDAADKFLNHSLFNGHPRFMGFITSSAAPIGALADMLASSVNPNVGGWVLSPMASEIELQTIRWLAELLGYPAGCGGLLVSGGNMANFVGFLCARKNKANWELRKEGMASPNAVRLRIYASPETHTWLQKAADLFGLGTDAIHWIETDKSQRIRTDLLVEAIRTDRKAGEQPFLVVGSAGTVSTGAVDPLCEIAAIAKREDLWFHVDGAYGACAAALPESSADLKALCEADSVAFDPHKWLYAPIEAGCTLVKNPEHLVDAFSYRPPYYAIDYDRTNFYEIGPQNSRGFRALKVWLGLRQAGRVGCEQMIRDDIALAVRLFESVSRHPELEHGAQGLSIATFRYVPLDLRSRNGEPETAEYLDKLNRALMDTLNKKGELFLSNAVVNGRFWLRACIVNFRTTEADVDAVPEIVVREGGLCHAALKPA